MAKKNRKGMNVSRRDFLKKGATVGVGATALGGIGASGAAAQNFWDMSADFVTIGPDVIVKVGIGEAGKAKNTKRALSPGES